MNIFEQTLGLVHTDDLISLSSGVVYEREDGLGYVFDEVNGARHLVSAEANKALNLLSTPILLDDWLKLSGLGYEQSSQILRFLDSIAGLNVARSVKGSVVHMVLWLQLKTKGFKPMIASRRLSGSVGGVMLGSLSSIYLLSFLILVSIFMAYGTGLLNASFIVAQFVMLFGVLLTTIVHELTHLSIAKNQNVAAAVVTRGARIGIIHGELSDDKELKSAVLGPLYGAVASALIFFATIFLEQSWFVVLSAGVLVIFHFLSWLPSYGDGKAIQKIMKGAYQAD